MKTWCVKDKQARKTIGHVYSILLKDVKFIVRKSGNEKILSGGVKTVHAFVEGEILSYNLDNKDTNYNGIEVKYNPHKGFKQFCKYNNDCIPSSVSGFDELYTEPIYEAKKVLLTNNWKVIVIEE